MKFRFVLMLAVAFLLTEHDAAAKLITATPANYTSLVNGLQPGDTLLLTSGSYMNQLSLNALDGTPAAPIVIMGQGNSTILYANACCNTVDMVNCSYIVIKDFKIDGQNIDYVFGVSADGGGNAFAHHITVENILIVNNGGSTLGDNQTDGISTKCAAWNWTIRNCIIIGAGTGLYLGNSDGTCPFVGGLIENNLVIDTRGYNMEIKEQLDTVRKLFPGTSTDSQKTIIRYNVWSKDTGSTPIGVDDGSRPCILMDNFPSAGYGSHDMYEVYGNFFYNNPTEALMQVTANTTAYDNLFFNNVTPSGYFTVLIDNHNGFAPRSMNFFHNTVLTNSNTAGIELDSPDTNYKQYCYANAVFSGAPFIAGFAHANSVGNEQTSFSSAGAYVNSTSTPVSALDLYPRNAYLKGTTAVSDTLFTSFDDYNLDFNGNPFDWTYKGAYSGSGTNPGWQLALDTMPRRQEVNAGVNESNGASDFLGMVYPNPATERFTLDIQLEKATHCVVTLTDLEGRTLETLSTGDMTAGSNEITADATGLAAGFYLMKAEFEGRAVTRKILIEK